MCTLQVQEQDLDHAMENAERRSRNSRSRSRSRGRSRSRNRSRSRSRNRSRSRSRNKSRSRSKSKEQAGRDAEAARPGRKWTGLMKWCRACVVDPSPGVFFHQPPTGRMGGLCHHR